MTIEVSDPAGNAPSTASAPADRISAVLPMALAGIGLAAFLGAGALMWSRFGDSVFADLISAAIAWCM